MKQNFVVLVFPAEGEKELLELAPRFRAHLTRACGTAPTVIWPSMTALALLVEGEEQRISSALDEAAGLTTRYLYLQAGAPFGGAGLSTAFSWLRGRTT